MSEQRANVEIDDLISSLDAEFGKKIKKKGRSDADIRKDLNTKFHADNPVIKPSFAKQQLEKMRFENYYDWEIHRQALQDGQLELLQDAGEPTLQWLPDARITYIINQHCACCKGVMQFVGNEYIRFRGRRRRYKDIEGVEHWTHPTMLRRVGEVDGNLLAFGQPNGDPLPDFVEEMNETVSRCPGCINLEMRALDLWIKTVQPSVQGELLIDIPLTEDGR